MRSGRHEGFGNQYARTAGELELTGTIADILRRLHGLAYDPHREITIFCGATEAIHCAVLAFCDPGDEVVMLGPFYDSYPACCSLGGVVPKLLPLRAPLFRWTEEDLKAAFTPRTRLLLLNTPHNPTGRVLDRGEMEVLAGLCRDRDVLCVTDEVYDRLVFQGEHIPMATLPGMRERTVSINSLGKSFSLTGWKIGYASAPESLSSALAAVHQFVTFAAATPLQHAAAAALRAPEEYFADLLAAYRERRDFLTESLTAGGFTVRPPEGTYFILADIRPLGWEDGDAFCRHLVEQVGVAAVPAQALYADGVAGREDGRHLVRFAFCKSMETLREGSRRLTEASPAGLRRA